MQVRHVSILKAEHIIREVFAFFHGAEKCRMSADQERHGFRTQVGDAISDFQGRTVQPEGDGEAEVIGIYGSGEIIRGYGQNDIVGALSADREFHIFDESMPGNRAGFPVDRHVFRDRAHIGKQYRRSLGPVGRVFLPEIFFPCGIFAGKKFRAVSPADG